MKITLENTAKFVELDVTYLTALPARIWQGHTDTGVPVFCFITRIAPEVTSDDPRFVEVTTQFANELMEQAAPREAVQTIPARLILGQHSRRGR